MEASGVLVRELRIARVTVMHAAAFYVGASVNPLG
jgi:hypothetical protein